MPNHTICRDPLLNVKEAATLLGVSVPTFWRRVADGTVTKPVKLGGMTRWFVSDIQALLDSLKERRVA